MIKDYLNEANGVYEKNYETDLPEKYHCTECLAEIKKSKRNLKMMDILKEIKTNLNQDFICQRKR